MEYQEKESVSFSHIGRQWHIYRADMESLWENMEQDQDAMQAFQEDERLPYWAELWPSSFGLAAWLKQKENAIKGQNCLDLGCGLGFTALCGAACGAKVLACDYEKRALELTRFNAKKNAIMLCNEYRDFWQSPVSVLCPLFLDWRCPCIEEKKFPFIWAADIAYERKFMPEILKFLEYALTMDGIFWIAEPSRTIYQYFLEEVKNFSFSIEKVYAELTPKISEHILPARVNIWELKRK